MNVLSVASKLGESKLGGLRRGHGRRPATRAHPPVATSPSSPDRSRSKRLGGHAQDTALYNCECGMVFDAAVSTAVSCPHCGAPQAW